MGKSYSWLDCLVVPSVSRRGACSGVPEYCHHRPEFILSPYCGISSFDHRSCQGYHHHLNAAPSNYLCVRINGYLYPSPQNQTLSCTENPQSSYPSYSLSHYKWNYWQYYDPRSCLAVSPGSWSPSSASQTRFNVLPWPNRPSTCH